MHKHICMLSCYTLHHTLALTIYVVFVHSFFSQGLCCWCWQLLLPRWLRWQICPDRSCLLPGVLDVLTQLNSPGVYARVTSVAWRHGFIEYCVCYKNTLFRSEGSLDVGWSVTQSCFVNEWHYYTVTTDQI